LDNTRRSGGIRKKVFCTENEKTTSHAGTLSIIYRIVLENYGEMRCTEDEAEFFRKVLWIIARNEHGEEELDKALLKEFTDKVIADPESRAGLRLTLDNVKRGFTHQGEGAIQNPDDAEIIVRQWCALPN
jgi:hypothetical protein